MKLELWELFDLKMRLEAETERRHKEMVQVIKDSKTVVNHYF